MFLKAILAFSMFFMGWFPQISAANDSFKVKNLRVEYLKNPIGIDVEKPSFSWEMESDIRGTMQISYEIIVSTDEAGVNAVWNSGQVISDKSIHVKYEGNALAPSTRYYWHVNVWNNNNTKATSNETAFFETGLLNSGWGGAQWIKATTTQVTLSKDSRLHVTGKSYSRQKSSAKASDKFSLEMDMTLVKDNAGIVFAAKDMNNMHMWSINTRDNADQPLLRRHIYTNGTPIYNDVLLGNFFSKKDLLGKERHIKIDVENSIIKTYIDGILVDSYTDTSNTLTNGYIGFRAYNGNNTDENAYYDNIVLKSYLPDENNELKPTITFSENFEKGESKFDDTGTVVIDGNTKLNLFSRNGDFRVLQNSSMGIPMFRKEFSFDKEVKSARIYSSALGIYDIFINGKRVGIPMSDGKFIYDEFKPGWADYSKTVHYMTYDVTNLLHSGANAIGARVSSGWWAGGIAHGEYGSPELGFIAKLLIEYTDGSTENIVTDNTWLSSTSGPILMGDIYNGEKYDARNESNWASVGYDYSKWNRTAINTSFKGELKAFVGPTVQVRPELCRRPISITTYRGVINTSTAHGMINSVNVVSGGGIIKLKKGETAVYDMGQNMVGWVKFAVKGGSGTKMKLRFGEMLNGTGDTSRGDDGPGGSIYTINLRSAKATLYYTLKGDQNGETFNPSTTFFGFRYCEVTATQDIVIKSLIGEVVGSVTEEGSSFRTSSDIVNQLYSNVVWGQRSNFLSIPTDCPQRDERLGWTGDTQIFCKAATYNADVAAFFHKWMGDMRDSQRSDGAYPDVAPHSWVGYGTSAWADAGIIVPWTIYLMYNDKDIIEENYESMEKYMDFLANRGGGGYKYNGAGTSYGDWLSYESTDARYISVCYYAYTAQLMAKMSQALSKEDGDTYSVKAKGYTTLYNDIKSEFQTRYVNSDGSLKQTSQTAYLLALKLDLFPTLEATNKAVTFLTQKISLNGDKLSTGFVGTGILNQTLSQHGASDTAYNLLLQRSNPSWLYSVDQGATTIWERWNSYTKESGFNSDITMNSFNHYSYGAVSEWMYRFMGGIESDEAYPGFKHIIFQPTPDTRTKLPSGQEHITWVNATYKSYYGAIKSAWAMKGDGRITYTATVPINTTATLYLPLLTDNDKIYEHKILAKDAEGVTFIGVEKGKAIFTLQSGSYSFEVSEGKDTGIKDTSEKIFIYPNPISNILNINAQSFY